MAIISNRWVKGGGSLPLSYFEDRINRQKFVDQDGQIYELGRKVFGLYQIIKDEKTMYWDISQTDSKFNNNEFKLI